jgi:hypothetical protein
MGSDAKKTFLKWKIDYQKEGDINSASKGISNTAKKNYKYYADNFKKDINQSDSKDEIKSKNKNY